MAKNFWAKIKTPILALAPLAGVTDSPFRRLAKKYGADVLYSEMASATALFYQPSETLKLLKFTKTERPYVVQLFGSDPKHFAVAAKLITRKIKPDGIDINFGCPVKKVTKQGAGAALMADLKNSRAVLQAVLQNTTLPVSIKVRTESGKIKLVDFLKNISDLPIAALMIHGRTLKQGFNGPIDLKAIKAARRHFSGVILANGGIDNYAEMKRVLAATGADGVGIGRGALGRPWIFQELRQPKFQISQKEIFQIAGRHAQLMFKQKGQPGLLEMRKHLCWYVNGLAGAKKLREKMVRVESLADIKKILAI
jgi:nifR3 family TIM-barrel protein